jgi:hypothetical protein
MLIANIANINQTHKITIMTLKIAPTDIKREFTISFIATLCEITLKGLNVLKSLRILITGISTFVRHISNVEVATIKQSITFQLSLKYEPSSMTKPKATIFVHISN